MSKDDGPLPDKYTYLTTDRKGTGVLKVTGGTFETKNMKSLDMRVFLQLQFGLARKQLRSWMNNKSVGDGQL